MKVTARLDDTGLFAALDKLGRVAEDVIYSGAAAMARFIYEEVRINTTGAIAGTPGIVTGTLHESIYWVKDKDSSTKQRAVYEISWNRSKAPHGHLLEFGTSKMAAHPFVTPAAGKLPAALKVGQIRMAERFAQLAGLA